jgi:hypothetical protein
MLTTIRAISNRNICSHGYIADDSSPEPDKSVNPALLKHRGHSDRVKSPGLQVSKPMTEPPTMPITSIGTCSILDCTVISGTIYVKPLR